MFFLTCIEDADFALSYFDTEVDACALVFASYFRCLRNLDCAQLETDEDCYAALVMGVESDC